MNKVFLFLFFFFTFRIFCKFFNYLCKKFFNLFTADCFDPSCNGHGTCLNGLCLCEKGWKGADCKETDAEAIKCLPECSGHGTFNIESGQCICEGKWTGSDCSKGNCRKESKESQSN